MAVSANLLADAKNELDITYTDTAVDTKLTAILSRGIDYLQDIAGGEMDFEAEGKPKELLFEYARYARAEKLQQYTKDWAHGIHRLKQFGGDTDVVS